MLKRKQIKVEGRSVAELPDPSMNSAEDSCMVRGQKRKVSDDDEGLFSRPAKEMKRFHHVLSDEEQASSSVETSKDPKTKMLKRKQINVEGRSVAEDSCMVRGQKRKVSDDDEGLFRPAKEMKLFHLFQVKRRVIELPIPSVNSKEDVYMFSTEISESSTDPKEKVCKRKATGDGKASPAKKPKSLDQEESKCSAKQLEAAKICEFKAKYVELHKLGRGGFGTVFAGYRKEDNFPVAIKHISKRCVPIKVKAENGKRISVEVAAMLRLAAGTPGSSATVSLLDWFDLRKELILVMERPVPAVDLDKYIEEHADTITEETAKKVTFRAAMPFFSLKKGIAARNVTFIEFCSDPAPSLIFVDVILKQLIEAAKELEDKNVFHRDIKTNNILIETGSDVPRVRLIDFGVSCFFNERSRYTVFAGTPAYCPPEWMIHEYYRPGPTTVWQLGTVLYEILHAESSFDTQFVIKEKLKISEELSENCQDFLKMCFNLDPKRRPKLEDLLLHRWFR